MKKCGKCKEIKETNEFRIVKYKDKNRYRKECKLCEKQYRAKYFKSLEGKLAVKKYHQSDKGKQAKHKSDKKYREKVGYNPSEKRLRLKTYWQNQRRLLIQQATISGFGEKIKEIYLNCPKGYQVDHEIPLKHEFVCGLNVPWNLQYLTPKANRKKSNKFPYSVL